ncbi:hypothetical protein H312_01315 [Anncaliia algerae PRA339]|uniref:Septin-type G domain-containing protein n=1 Tax=Anncaliia algerae PRA339 TaxID=1288291 RepID=A0A059F1S2_9MICR|nr:hypothetical protein H312_01315 [Anncaliia algerae PRA339]
MFVFMEENGIGVSNLPNQRYRGVFKKQINYNIMILGSKGLGKTQFLNNVFSLNIPYDHKNIVRHSFIIKENHYKMKLSILEVDSINDSTDNTDTVLPIAAYIKEELEKFKEIKEEKKEDNRIHAVIYFFEPLKNDIKETDLVMMKTLSKYSNFIPVVAKSDLLSVDIPTYKSFLLQRLEEERINLYSSVYFLINGNKIENDFVRIYNWGVLCVNNISFNEFNELKKLLLTRNLVDLVHKVEYFFVAYQTENILKKIGSEIK